MSMPSIYLPILCLLPNQPALFSASSALSGFDFPLPLSKPLPNLLRVLRVFLRVSAPPRQIYALTPPGLPPQSGYSASISSATRFLTSCRASHRYLNASFLNTCFFNVSDPIPKSSSFLASSRSLLKSPMSNSSIPDTSIVTSSCRASAIPHSRPLWRCPRLSSKPPISTSAPPRPPDPPLVLPSLRDPPQHMLHRLLHH